MAVGDKTRYGTILAEWTVPEYIKYEHSLAWYIVAGSIAGLVLLQALYTLNFLFAIIIVLIVAIVYLHDRRHPEMLDFLILETGVALGDRFFPYQNLESFWIIYEPPTTKLLYFGINRTLRRELPIHLENENPVTVRSLLLKYLPEDLSKETEASEERLSRLFRL